MFNELWTITQFIEAAEAYSYHLAELEQQTYTNAIEQGASPQLPEAIGVTEHNRHVAHYEAILRRYIDRFPTLRSHWAVSEYELNFLDE